MMLLDVVIDPLAVRGGRWSSATSSTTRRVACTSASAHELRGMVDRGALVSAVALDLVRSQRALGRASPGRAWRYTTACCAFNLVMTAWIGEWMLAGSGFRPARRAGRRVRSFHASGGVSRRRSWGRLRRETERPAVSDVDRRHLRAGQRLRAGSVIAGADAGAALPLQPRLRGVREDPVPGHILRRHSPSSSAGRREECGAPMVSIPGGEPSCIRHRTSGAGSWWPARKYVYLCHERSPLEESSARASSRRPSTCRSRPHGRPREEHDEAVCRDGVYGRGGGGHLRALRRGFRVTTNHVRSSDAPTAAHADSSTP